MMEKLPYNIDPEQFRRDGYTLLESFADSKICDAIRELAEVHLKYRIEPLETETEYHCNTIEQRSKSVDYSSRLSDDAAVRRLRQVYDRDIVFRRWMEDRKIRPILNVLLEDRPVIVTAHHNSIMTKMPLKGTETRWHRDIRYWHYTDDNLISIWLALGNENGDNGVLEFIPGSHRMEFGGECFDEKEYFIGDKKNGKDITDSRVSYDLKKGDVVIFHSKLLHRANRNRTDRPKISFVYTVKGSKTLPLPDTRSSHYREIVL